MKGKFEVYKEAGWVPFFKGYWRMTDGSDVTDENPTGRHGAYPARWVAWLSGWLQTR